MPNIRGRFNELIGRQLSQFSNCNNNSKRNSLLDQKDIKSSNGSFINRYLNGKLNKSHPDILSGKTCYDLPVKEIHKLSNKVVSASTGPGDGLTHVNRRSKPFDLADADVDFIDEDYNESNNSLPFLKNENISEIISKSNENNENKNKNTNNNNDSNDENWEQNQSIISSENQNLHKSATLALGEEIAGITCWDSATDNAYGIATTLYECHPNTKEKAGEPIADSFGLCVRENSAVLALADGVNWGEKSCLAARCAVHGCVDYMNKALYSEGSRIENTMDIFVALLRSFNAAHNLILQENGLLTTLCAAVVCQLKNSDRFIVCTCNVGDSLAYVYSEKYGVREITQGSHDIYSMRDMRDALGALGPVDGTNPELNNLTVAMTIVDKGDIVFLTSDGITDNFDPVVGKFAIPKKEKPYLSKSKGASTETSNEAFYSSETEKTRKSRLKRSNSNPDRETAHRPAPIPDLPVVSAHQRHELTLLRMEDLLLNGVNENDNRCNSAKKLCQLMTEFSMKLTTAKRRILEDPDLYDNEDNSFGQYEQRQRRRRVGDKLAMVPGKLDHASIVAYKVAFYGPFKEQSFGENSKNEDRYNLRAKATLARFESQEDCSDLSESTL